MTNTHHIYWPTNTSVTIRKGNFEVTLGHQSPKVGQTVPPPTPMPANKTPWTGQEQAFILVVSVALVLAGRWLWKNFFGPLLKFKVF